VQRSAHGHAFAIRGDLSRITADAYILPSDAYGKVEHYWGWLAGQSSDGSTRQLTGSARALRTRHHAWVDEGGRPRVLAVDVGGDTETNFVHEVADRFSLALEELEAMPGSKDASPRSRPLVAMPLIGVAGGGLGENTGTMITELLATISRHFSKRNSDTRAFDIALVCRSSSDYAAVQHARRQGLTGSAPAWLAQIVKHAQSHQLAVLFGAGASASQGLPLWDQLLRELALALPQKQIPATALAALDPVDAATLLIEAGGEPWFTGELRSLLWREDHSLTHGLIANLKPALAITTNYDRGYELAVESMGGLPLVVLPWDRSHSLRQPHLLKLHGDLERGQIVLSRDEFVAMQAFRRPLTGILQERMLVGHVLTVGTSMTDSTLVHAAEEVRALVQQALAGDAGALEDRGKSGTALLTLSEPGQEMLLERAFEVAVASTGHSNETGEAARQIDVLLDWVAMMATDDLSFVLSTRYRGLLSDGDQSVADVLHSFARQYQTHREDHAEASDLQTSLDAYLQSLGLDVAEGWG